MRLFFDTTLLVDIERRKAEALRLMRRADAGDHDLLISTISVAEIFTGCHLRPDAKQALERARLMLNQFQWQEVDGEVALRIGQIAAYLRLNGRPIAFPDVAIAATAAVTSPDLFITDNAKDFGAIPPIDRIVCTPRQALSRLA